MAVHIRLQRKGTTNRAFYHLVAADHRAPRDGRYLEKVGYYDPNTNPSVIELKVDKIQAWYEKGAQLSDQVKNLIKRKSVNLSRKASPAVTEA